MLKVLLLATLMLLNQTSHCQKKIRNISGKEETGVLLLKRSGREDIFASEIIMKKGSYISEKALEQKEAQSRFNVPGVIIITLKPKVELQNLTTVLKIRHMLNDQTFKMQIRVDNLPFNYVNPDNIAVVINDVKSIAIETDTSNNKQYLDIRTGGVLHKSFYKMN